MGLFDRSNKTKATGEQSMSFSEIQGKAMDVGFSMGSKLSLVALPINSRKRTFSGMMFNKADLALLMSQLSIGSSENKNISDNIENALGQENPINAANKLLESVNRIKDLLTRSKFPELMRVYRIGFALGYSMETAAIVSSANPTQKHLDMFVTLTQKYRDPLPDDIQQANLPSHLVEQIRRTNIEVNSVDDLHKIINGCKLILNESRN